METRNCYLFAFAFSFFDLYFSTRRNHRDRKSFAELFQSFFTSTCRSFAIRFLFSFVSSAWMQRDKYLSARLTWKEPVFFPRLSLLSFFRGINARFYCRLKLDVVYRFKKKKNVHKKPKRVLLDFFIFVCLISKKSFSWYVFWTKTKAKIIFQLFFGTSGVNTIQKEQEGSKMRGI